MHNTTYVKEDTPSLVLRPFVLHFFRIVVLNRLEITWWHTLCA